MKRTSIVTSVNLSGIVVQVLSIICQFFGSGQRKKAWLLSFVQKRFLIDFAELRSSGVKRAVESAEDRRVHFGEVWLVLGALRPGFEGPRTQVVVVLGDVSELEGRDTRVEGFGAPQRLNTRTPQQLNT